MSDEEKAELEELYENSEWWHNRFKAVQRDYENLQQKIDKAIEYIKNNCVLSDEWRDLGFCNFIPTGKITYKQLTPKKVKELLEILGDKENE